MCQGSLTAREALTEQELRAERKRLRLALRAGGYALTARRLAIYEILLRANDHICVEHTLASLARDHPHWRVNKTTVYRAFDLFKSLGLVYEMKHSDGRAQYELALHGQHGHLICRLCGKLADLAPDIAARFQHELQDRAGFEVDLANYAVLGLCHECAAGH